MYSALYVQKIIKKFADSKIVLIFAVPFDGKFFGIARF